MSVHAPSARRAELCLRSGKERTVRNMWTVLLILLVAWVVLSIVGFVFDGLMWLGIIGIVLFVGTLIFGILRRHARRPKP
jgi:fatty acid desaturase